MVYESAEKAERVLKELSCRHLDGATLVLFSSRADETHDRRSDFDTAYLPREDLDPMSFVRLREDIEIEESNVTYDVYDMDLVDLSRVEESFREKVFSEGVVWKS